MTYKLAKGRTATLIKLAFAAGAKVSAALVAFALTALVTRSMPKDEAGLFLLGFTLLAVLSVFFRLGLDGVILRFISAHGVDDFSQEKLNRGLLWIGTVTIPSAILGMVFSEQIAIYIFDKPTFGPVLFWMLLALPAMAIFFFLSMAFQGQHRVVLTTVFQNLGISTLFISGFGYLWFNQPEAINAVRCAQIYAIAAGVVLLASIVIWFSQSNTAFKVTNYRDPELTSASLNLWVAVCMGLAVQWSGILIAGSMLTAEDVALLTVAQRTAMLTSFVLMIVNMVAAPRYARMWKEQDLKGMQRLAKQSTMVMILLVSPVVFVMLLFSRQIMSLFGNGFEDAAILLMILVGGQFINVATGSVGFLLNMSGHESDYNRVTLFTGPLTIVLALVLTNYFGVLGAAIATAIGVAVHNIGATMMVKVRLGFLPIA